MQQSFTSEQLIQYLYHETSAADTLAISDALDSNFELREEYEDLFQAYLELPKVQFGANPKILKNILCYSEMTAVERHC
ncbi:MAG TPA: hypothetical protein PKE06_15355 [Flavilitoribacter sp.]|nr:hypothetical protein [Lewinella sp.]MCB9277425.1 hypothetical protein [Lewinellaceae bacterium]HMQ62050.1 hypothetical protein [Flavilitoribacter sp.]HMQ86584.1 hypothetical protein [Flavilitoribacter sp.]